MVLAQAFNPSTQVWEQAWWSELNSSQYYRVKLFIKTKPPETNKHIKLIDSHIKEESKYLLVTPDIKQDNQQGQVAYFFILNTLEKR